MGAFSDGLTTTATNLLTKFGTDATFRREVEGDYNPITGEVGNPTITTFSAKVQTDSFNNNEVDGTVVKRSDTKLIVNNVGSVPMVGDTVTFSSNTYRVFMVNPVQAQGADVIYILGVRK